MVSVSCFGVRVSVMFHFMFVHYTFVQFGLLCGHLLGNSCPLGYQFVLIVFCLFVIFIYFPFGFKSGICLLNAPVPVHCFSFTFLQYCHIAFMMRVQAKQNRELYFFQKI